MKLVTKLALATTGVVLGLTTLDIQNASAANLSTYQFKVVSPTLTGSGRFTFDNAILNSNPDLTAPVQSLTFSFDGQPSVVYTNEDDLDFPNFPLAFSTTYLTGRNTIGLDFTFDDRNPLSDLGYEIYGEDFTAYPITDANITPAFDTVVFGTVSYTKVPEPATVLAGFVTCGAALFMKKKGTSAKKVGA